RPEVAVERVVKVLPHVHSTFVSTYSGWMSFFTRFSSQVGRRVARRIAPVNRSQGDSLPEHPLASKSSRPALVASRAMTSWTEIGPGIFTRRHGRLDVAVSVILGPEGAVVVDSLADPRSGAALRSELTALSPLPLVAVVLTHAHYDHTFGLAGLLAGDDGVLVLAHAGLEAHLREHEAAELEAGRRGDLALATPHAWDDVELPVPGLALTQTRDLELGGRSFTLWPLRTAHS